MADLFALLSWSSSSLSAYRSATATASHNLSNANTPGFARQRAELAATLPGNDIGGALLGRGVTLSGVSQVRDTFVEHQLPSALGNAGRSAAHAAGLEGVSALNPEGGLSQALTGFYSALRDLSQKPGDLGVRQATVGAARSVAFAFNSAAQNLAQARNGLDAQLSAQVYRVNDLAARLAGLNQQVRIESGTGGVPNDLLDARLRVQDELVQLTGASVVPDSDGNVNLELPGNGGALVVGHNAATLSAAPDSANGGHLALRLTAFGNTAFTVLNTSSVGGALGGALDARDGALAQAEGTLDTLAFEWAAQINAVHGNGYGLDASTGRDLFSVSATASGAARALALDAGIAADPRQIAASATAAGIPGDSANLFDLIATETQALPTGGVDVFRGLSGAIAAWGSSVQMAQGASERDATVKEQLMTLRESTSGVSIDDELIALTQAQRGYEAVMKVITTTDKMLETLLNMR